MSFPHNPTTTCVDLDFMQKVVDFAREHDVVVVHDNAYADLGFDGWKPPSILQAEGARDFFANTLDDTGKLQLLAFLRTLRTPTNPAVDLL